MPYNPVTAAINEVAYASGLRYCSKCDKLKALSEFKTGYCSDCRRAYERTQESRKIKEARNKRKRTQHIKISGTHTKQEWLALLAQYNHKCLSCGSSENIQKDHIMPIALLGTDTIDNLQPLCATCNQRKGARYIDYRGANDPSNQASF